MGAELRVRTCPRLALTPQDLDAFVVLVVLAAHTATDAVDRAFGRIDVWVNNAMVSVFSPFPATSMSGRLSTTST